MLGLKRSLAGLSTAVVLALSGGACSTAPPPPNASGSGGRGGNGGGGMGGAQVVTCGSENPDDLISDFATDNGIHPADGRSGGWYVYGDALGAFDPAKDPDPLVAYPIDAAIGNTACSNAGSFHVKGAGFRMWGAAAAADFVPKVGTAKGTYDASKYKGISFWAKANAPLNFVQVKFPDAFTDAEADPSTIDPTALSCVLAAGFPNNCSPYLVKLSAPTGDANYQNYQNVKIGTAWNKFEILFADAKQDQFNPGQKSPGDMLDVRHLLGFAVQVNANFSTTPATANDFEMWIDDVRFIPK